MNIEEQEYQEGFRAVPILVKYQSKMELKQKAVRHKAGTFHRDYWRGIFDGLSLWDRITTEPIQAQFD